MNTTSTNSEVDNIRQELLSDYQFIRNQSEIICNPLKTEDYVVQPVPEVSPPKWHLAHTTWFFETFVLKQYHPYYQPFDPRFDYLFNSYYTSMGERWDRSRRGELTRPTVDEIFRFRYHVDKAMRNWLLEEEVSSDVMELIRLGLHHEQQHQELLLTDIKFILGHNPLFPAYDPENERELEFEDWHHEWLSLEPGLYQIGYEGVDFSYDNESPKHQVYLPGCLLSNKLVTNGEYLEFMAASGYENPLLWHSDGWAWKEENGINSPLYWNKLDGKWMRYGLEGLHPIEENIPVTHISFYEAYAFANWKGCRLPTEQEWEVMSDQFNWGLRWEWTGSAYLPYPGYKVPEGAIGEYNGKFMVNQMVLRGASIATPENHSRKTYRNFFHPQYQWQFNGIRLCKDRS